MKCLHFFPLLLCVLNIGLQGMARRQPISSGKPYHPNKTRQVHVTPHRAPAPQGFASASASVRQVRDELPLPMSLRRLAGVSIHHIVVTKQGSDQCGSRSVANALAVQDVIMSGQTLNSSSIRAQASQYDRILINHILEWAEVANLACRNNLFNAHIMARIPKEQTEAVYPYVVYSTDGQEHSLDDLATSLLTHETMTAHIICNTGGHWVLITIIKQEGHVPQMLYMDSCNGILQDDSAATAYICYLYNTCLA
ncbi:MAG TPA: hypothetical protein PKD74_00630 [Candidatus Dependentiae bacterium]|jgi:hypothetical protein|nr:hypothetical protein [Candidatus Dependentiae bacterium]